jgi:hypothetical protein
MSFIDDQFDNWLMQDALGFHDDEECEFDDTFIIAQRQKPSHLGGVDWRYEKGGVFYDE